MCEFQREGSLPRSREFEGRVIDGPLEGQTKKYLERFFRVPIYKPLSLMLFTEPPATAMGNFGIYQWSRSLRGWVFRWDLWWQEHQVAHDRIVELTSSDRAAAYRHGV